MAHVQKHISNDIQSLLNTYNSNAPITRDDAVTYFRNKGAKYPERSTIFLFNTYGDDEKITIDDIRGDASKKIEQQFKKQKIEDSIHEDIQTFLLTHNKNKDKKIDRSELLKYLQESGSTNPQATVEFTFKEVDSDGDHIITIREIENYSNKKKRNLLSPTQ